MNKMYNLKKNNYHLKPKSSNIQTPLEVSQFIFELLRDKIERGIFDPCCGEGNLLKPWKEAGYNTVGNDIINIENRSFKNSIDYDIDFLHNWTKSVVPSRNLILCNPPFNGYGSKLGSEVWLDKIIELFGKDISIVLFVPIGFRLNLTLKSKRWLKLTNGTYPSISSLIALPKNIFPEVVFHSEILIFNIKGLKSHYFYRRITQTC